MMASKGILTARGGLVSHAAVVARGWGTPAVVGADAVKITGKQFQVGDTVVKQGDWLSLDGTTGEVIVGKLELAGIQAAGGVRHDPQVGGPDPQGQARRARQRRHRRGRRRRPADGRRGHRPVPHRAHVPRSRPAADRARDDPRQHAQEGGGGAREAPHRPAGRLRGDPRGDGRAARHGSPARPAAARVPAVGRGAAGQGRQEAAVGRRSRRCSTPPRAGPSTTR